MKQTTIFLFGYCFLCAVFHQGCSKQEISLSSQMSLKNSDVDFQGTAFGLHPIVNNPIAKIIIKSKDSNIDDRLFEMLDDENTFVVAHVLLSYRYKIERENSVESWDGLKVEILADNEEVIDSRQRAELKKMWAKRLSKR